MTAKSEKPLDLPTSIITRHIKKDSNKLLSKKARESITRASTIWILYISHMANANAKADKRVTVLEKDVLKVLENNGFIK
ncbi:DNA polymerase epsilon subunit 3 [Bonamia ostreae]|uniref:DNA polymerase epsilon subunit 3 n=1 Tax=Bonamia ostreae TaxID=126728 RepID=A0ABV2ALX8_9EUKA